MPRTSTWTFPAPSLTDIGQLRRLHRAPWSVGAGCDPAPVERAATPRAAKSRNDLVAFVFVSSYVKLPGGRKPKKQPSPLPACSLAVNGTGLTVVSPCSHPPPVDCRGLEACMACGARLWATIPAGPRWSR